MQKMQIRSFFLLFALCALGCVGLAQEFDDYVFAEMEARAVAQETAKQLFLSQEDCSIFENYPETRSFVCNNTSDNFIFELLGDSRKEHLQAFIGRFWELQFDDVTDSEKDLFLVSIMKLLVNQTETNPPQYVSHGTDHSVRVLDWATRLHIVSDLAKGMEMAYETTPIQSQFILGLIGLLHDIGYADIDQHKVPKWLHSVSSGIMVDRLLDESNSLGRRILKGSGQKTENLARDFIAAISTHNFDDGFCRWNESNPLYAKECTFTCHGDPNDPKSSTTPLLDRKEPYTRGYVLGYADRTPLAFAVRVADNLDAVRTRLTPVQNDKKLMKFFLRIYQDEDLRHAVATDADDLDAKREAARQRAAKATGLDKASPEQRLVMDRANEQSWLHFYSNWLIESSNIDPVTWTIEVNLFNLTGSLGFDSHPGSGLYQINRLASAALSCHVNERMSFLDLVRLNFNLPVNDLDGGTFLPLKAFTKKPVYDSKGQSKWDDGKPENICDPYCSLLTKSLTYSSEPCVSSDGVVTPNCPFEGFSKVPPFTDLSYPGSLLKVGTKGGLTGIQLGLIIGGACVLAFAVVFVTIVVFVRRRSRDGGYEEIPTK